MSSISSESGIVLFRADEIFGAKLPCFGVTCSLPRYSSAADEAYCEERSRDWAPRAGLPLFELSSDRARLPCLDFLLSAKAGCQCR